MGIEQPCLSLEFREVVDVFEVIISAEEGLLLIVVVHDLFELLFGFSLFFFEAFMKRIMVMYIDEFLFAILHSEWFTPLPGAVIGCLEFLAPFDHYPHHC